ncbi:sigma-70 family RNA polymerase sigma factor [Arachidicoccus sp.]|uniref:sigma-70 family RNA polymerase sigma factor n=1 Tax=Arachidicoccus sp. TaxID=1872624 RepID=UPI003D2158CF
MTDNQLNVINPHKWAEKYADYLYAYALRRLDDKEQAKDLVQETFLAALEKVDKFEGRSSERTWLTSIIKNKIFDIYRAKTSALKHLTLCEAYPQYFNQEDGHWKVDLRPQEFYAQEKNVLENQEFNRVLEQCLKKLPALWILVFKLKFMEEENTKEICNQLDVTPANYWVIIHRAKVSLRACLQKHWL